jgi:hypothetical protein
MACRELAIGCNEESGDDTAARSTVNRDLMQSLAN